MDASRPASAEHELSTAPVAFGREGPAVPGAVDNSAVHLLQIPFVSLGRHSHSPNHA